MTLIVPEELPPPQADKPVASAKPITIDLTE
jgi:hypothetical protein